MSYKFAINIGDSRIATNIYRFCLNHQINTPISLTCNCSDCCQTPANSLRLTNAVRGQILKLKSGPHPQRSQLGSFRWSCPRRGGD